MEEENGTDDDVESIEFELDVDKVLEDLYSDDYEQEEDEDEKEEREIDVNVRKEDEKLESGESLIEEEEESSQNGDEGDGNTDVGDTSKGTNHAESENEEIEEESEEIEFVDSTSTIKDDEEYDENEGEVQKGMEQEDKVEREEEKEDPDVVQEYEFIENMMSDHSSLSTLDVSHQEGMDDRSGPLNSNTTLLVTSNHERNKDWMRILGSSSTIPKPYIYHINLGSSEGKNDDGSDEISSIHPKNSGEGWKEDENETDEDGKTKSELKKNLTTGFKLLPVKEPVVPSIKMMSFGSSLDAKSNHHQNSTTILKQEGKENFVERKDENQHILSEPLTRRAGNERGKKMSERMISGTEDDVEDELMVLMKTRNDEEEDGKGEKDQLWMKDDEADDNRRSHGYSGSENSVYRERRSKVVLEGKKIKTGESDRFSSPEKRRKTKEELTIGIDDEEEEEREKDAEQEPGIVEDGNEVIHERLTRRNEREESCVREMMSGESEVTKRDVGSEKVEKKVKEEERSEVELGMEGKGKKKSELRGIFSNERKAFPSSSSFRDVNFDLDLFLEPDSSSEEAEKIVFAEVADKNEDYSNISTPNDKDSSTRSNQKSIPIPVAIQLNQNKKNQPTTSTEKSTIAEKDEVRGNLSSFRRTLDPFHGLSQNGERNGVTLELGNHEKESSYQGRNERNGQVNFCNCNCPNQVGQENHIMYQSSESSEGRMRGEKELDEPILPTMIVVKKKGMGTGSSSLQLILAFEKVEKEKGHESNGDKDWEKEEEDAIKGKEGIKKENEQHQFYDGRNKVRGVKEEEEQEMNTERKKCRYECVLREKVTGKSSSLIQGENFHLEMEILARISKKDDVEVSLPGINEQGHHHENGKEDGDGGDGKGSRACTLSQRKGKQMSGEDDGDGKEVSLYQGKVNEKESKVRRNEEESSKSVSRRWEGRGAAVKGKESIYNDKENDQVLMESEGCISATFILPVHTGKSICSRCCSSCALKEGNKLQSMLEQGKKKNESGTKKKNVLPFPSSSNERSSNGNNKLATSSSCKSHSSGTILNEGCISKQPLSPFSSQHTVDVGISSYSKGEEILKGKTNQHHLESNSSSKTFSPKINTGAKSKLFQITISTLEEEENDDQIGKPPREKGANEIRERGQNDEEEVGIRSSNTASANNDTDPLAVSSIRGRWSESGLKESGKREGTTNLTVIQERLKWLQSKLEQLDQRTIQLAVYRNKEEERPHRVISSPLKNNGKIRMVRKTAKMMVQNDEYNDDVRNVGQDVIQRFSNGRRKFRSESSSSSSSASSCSFCSCSPNFYCSRHRYRNHEYQSTPDIRTSSTSLLILIKRTTSMLRDEVRELELLGKY